MLSRIHEEDSFGIIERHYSQREELHRPRCHEIESLRLLVDEFIKNGISIAEMDGFFLFISDSANW